MTDQKINSETQLAFNYREGYQHGHAAALNQFKQLLDRGYTPEMALDWLWKHNQDAIYPWRSSAGENPGAAAPEIK